MAVYTVSTGTSSRVAIRPTTRSYRQHGIPTHHQDPEMQLLALRQVAERAGSQVVEGYVDHGISGAKSRNRRPAFDRLMKDATRRRFDVVMAWSVDRLGRSFQDLVAFWARCMRRGSICI
jgi:DNA invertase Pin-like site-specific DNA recombinase